MTVNVMLSVERKLAAAVDSSDYAGRSLEAKTAYQLGYCESLLACVLRDVATLHGEEALLKIMDRNSIGPVYMGG